MRPTFLARLQGICEPRLLPVFLLAMGSSWGAAADESAASMHARVSVEIGGAVIKGDSDDDWSFATVNTLILPGDTFWVEKEGIAEVEFSGGSFLRLADNSKTQIAQVYPSPTVEGWTGSFYVHRLNRSSGNFLLTTPAGTVDIGNDSLVRIDVVGEGASTVSVRFGHADVAAPGGERVRAHQGQRIYVDPGLLPSSPVSFDLSEEDDFDAWNRERVRLLVVGDEPVQSIPRSNTTPVGYSDLAANGEWVYVDNRQYWHPTVATDYVPYRQGHWSYVPSYGHVWVGAYPFSYVTSHYGRWSHHDHHGWLWSYDDVWGPAWVASYRYHDRYFWTPLDPYGHPVHYGHASIHIGDFVISVGASSYTYAHLHHGHHNVHAFHDDFFHDIHHGVHYNDGYLTQTIPNSYLGVNGIHAWNIFAGNYVQNVRPNLGAGVLVRDYTPRRVIRGLTTSGVGGGTAVARARRLERTSGVTQFAQSNPRSVRGQSIRTADVSERRSARTRSTAVPQTAIRQTSEAIQRTQRNRAASTAGNGRNAVATRGNASSMPATNPRAATSNRSVRTSDIAATANRGTSTPGTRTTTAPRATRSTDSHRVTTLPRANTGTRATTAPRGTTSPRATRSTDSPRVTTLPRANTGTRATTAPRATTSPRTVTTRGTGTRSVTLPERSGRDRSATAISTRTTTPRVTTLPQVSTSPRTTTRNTTTPRNTTVRSTTSTRTPDRLSGPSVRTPRVTTAPRVTTMPSVRTPSASTSPRTVNVPRATTAPRVNAPTRVTTSPRVMESPTRNAAPRVSTPTRQYSPSPRVSAPTRQSSPSPRVSAPTRQSSPTPRVSAPTRQSSPTPRISAPRQSSAPRVSAPSRSSAPRASSPSRSVSSSSSRGRSPRGR